MLCDETGRGEEAARLREQVANARKAKQTQQREPTKSPPRGNQEREPDLDEIIADLDAEYTGKLPEEALRAAQRRRDEIMPRLVQLIEQATQAIRAGNLPTGNGHLFALFLLTEFRAKESLPAILKAVSLPGEGPFDLFGDAITEDLARVLAALADDSPRVIDELITNRSLNEYVRWGAAQTYLHWVRDGLMMRDVAVQHLRKHLNEAIANRDSDVATGLVCELASFASREALGEIEKAFRLNLVDLGMVSLESVRKSLKQAESRFRQSLNHCRPTGVEDTVEELRSWASYSQKDPSIGRAHPTSQPLMIAEDRVQEDPREASLTVRNTRHKVGRNDPCPCGSGKKYKKCCGAG